MIRRILVATTAAVAASAMMVAAAGAATSVPPKIGPNQPFIGLVNGSSGVTAPAIIKVACPGPIHPGETTHPLAHQPLEVTIPAAVDQNTGNTGAKGNHITAYFGIPPTATTTAAGGLATFRVYGVAKPIPTTLTVPCSGTGYITFVPFPRAPGSARSFVVPVEFANIAGISG